MLRHWFPKRTITLIIGFLADKTVHPLLSRLNGASDRIIAVNTIGDRGMEAVHLKKSAAEMGIDIDTAADVHEALEKDMIQARSDSRVILIMGSHYLAQQVYKSIDFL
jgi:folylpolyglutamate synthase/dihydropteroate synthase